jgi:hypothetical protein
MPILRERIEWRRPKKPSRVTLDITPAEGEHVKRALQFLRWPDPNRKRALPLKSREDGRAGLGPRAQAAPPAWGARDVGWGAPCFRCENAGEGLRQTLLKEATSSATGSWRSRRLRPAEDFGGKAPKTV